EAVSYAAQLANKIGTDAIAITIAHQGDANELGNYGANKILTITDETLNSFNNQSYANAIVAASNHVNAETVVISNTNNGKAIAPIIAAKREAALITNAIELPSSLSPFTIKRKAFSSKAYALFSSDSNQKVISITPNAFGIHETQVSTTIESFSYNTTDSDQRLKSVSVDSATGKIPLPEAELVVSAGRGLKGPENWGMIEELADLLGAATACSKPVSDIGWRSHSEHVGQTGIAINPQLYIAVGISGAIQHLAGVNASKNIVVINTDPEAPFFKAADYGIVGDAFEVVPKLIEAIKTHKSNN
ncbi:MAG: electron transfer flavoprotein subunit alpha/FixB family protein, partial [Woeseiaceae bacterium]|nr:electron transfer flavoprotein subunit alpha/FixB family protein [Woeseiaceae bacterium]